MVFNKF